MAYHLPLVIAFSLRPRIQFVWGGCMLLPLQLLRPDHFGILKVPLDPAWKGCMLPTLQLPRPDH